MYSQVSKADLGSSTVNLNFLYNHPQIKGQRFSRIPESNKAMFLGKELDVRIFNLRHVLQVSKTRPDLP